MGAIEIDPGSRYASHELIPWWSQERVGVATVLVAGAGAIGNEVVKNLALLGCGNIVIYDMDRVEHGNLSRSVLFSQADEGRLKAEVAAEAAMRLNPDVNARWSDVDLVYGLGIGTVQDADVVLGCLDNRLARRSLNEVAIVAGTPWIDAAIEEMNGQVRLFGRGEGACYECLLRESDFHALQTRHSCGLLARQKVVEGKVPTAVTSASLVAAWQVQEALKFLNGQPVRWGTNLISQGLGADVYSTTMPRRKGCPFHDIEPIVATASVSIDAPWATILESARLALVNLRHDLVLGFDCNSCGQAWDDLGILGLVPEDSATCPECAQTAQLRLAGTVARLDPWSARTPRESGVCPGEILTATTESSEDTAIRFGDA